MRWVVALVLLLAALAGGLYEPARAQNNTIGNFCNKAVVYDASTNGATQLVAPGSAIQICGYQIWAAGTVNVDLVYGTGAACATGTTKITPLYQLVTQTGIADTSANFRGLGAPPGTALCINTSAGVAVQAIVYLAQGPS